MARLQRELARSEADVKWVEPENLHVTLKFLDEVTEEQRQGVEAALARVAGSEAPFSLGLDQLGAFPSMSAPRVIWVGLGEGRDTARRIAEAIEREVAALSLLKEERPFAAHITLGRVRSPRGRQALVHQLAGVRWESLPPWRVTSLALCRSELSSAGPHYTMLADIPLGSSQSTVHGLQ